MSVDDFMELITEYGSACTMATDYRHRGLTRAANTHSTKADYLLDHIRINLEALYEHG